MLTYFLITCLLILSNIFILAQQDVYLATLKLMEPTFKGEGRIIKFKPSTIVIRVKKKGVYIEQEIPAAAIKDIFIWYDFNNGRGALEGLLIGTGIGVMRTSWYYTRPRGAVGVFAGGGALIGFVIGDKKKKRFKLNGNLEAYHQYITQMQQLLIIK